MFRVPLRRAVVLAALLAAVPPAAPAPRPLRWGFSVVNRTARPAEGVELRAFAPAGTGALEASHPFRLETDGWGNRLMVFPLGALPPFGRAEVRVTAAPPEVRGSGRGSRRARKACLAPEPYIESAAPEIVRLAAALEGRRAGGAERLLRWVAANIAREPRRAEPRGALDALRRKAGDCTEAAHLFIALCRASGIPARAVGGYVLEEGQSFRPGAYHDWAEFYADGAWRPADPQEGLFDGEAGDRVAFRVRGGGIEDFPGIERFRVSGEGVEAVMVE